MALTLMLKICTTLSPAANTENGSIVYSYALMGINTHKRHREQIVCSDYIVESLKCGSLSGSTLYILSTLMLDTLPCVHDFCLALQAHSITKIEHPMMVVNSTTAAVMGIQIF